ncbi:MAG: 3-hydroxyacyl-CoA dehydrogenase NAD-binding domain-containing protein [Candidatus Eisenbacteria bacterium]
MTVFRVEAGEDPGVVHLVMSHPGRKLNVLDAAALDSLEQALTELEGRQDLAGVVLCSGKEGSFIAGADIEAIGAITDSEEVRRLIQRAHAVFLRLENMGVPTVAAIDGVCLGGGTELALACDSRVASDESRTQIGLPEVMLGIFPGFGGTTRLPGVVGYAAALDLILSGRSLDARRAEKMGLVARAVPATWLMKSAHERIALLAKRPEGERRDHHTPAGLFAWLLEGNPLGRRILFSQARKSVLARTGGHYPAPLAAIEVLERCVGQTREIALALECDTVSPLVAGTVCKNLVRIFSLSEAAKKAPVGNDPSIRPVRVQRLALAGAGVMGGGIAELASRFGVAVRLRDLKPEALQKGLQTIRSVVDERGRKKRMKAREKDAQMAFVSPTLELTGVHLADFAIEAVIEDLDIKRRVFAELEVRLRPDAVIATNTSSLSVDALGEGLKHPERFVGFHFFNPVHKMPLLEVVRGARTSDAALVTAVAFARRLGKTPVVVKDSPGFVVNRVLMPYLREAMHLLEEGYGVAEIDMAMKRFGMPMGPFEVVDEVGLDVAHKVGAVLTHAFPTRMAESQMLVKLVESGRLGRKNGRGFYVHQGRRRTLDASVRGLLGLQAERRARSSDLLAERMVLAMINESARCVEERIVTEAGHVDLALVFGAGFPPFRGGPLRYADTIGLPHVVQRLKALEAEQGARFIPCEWLIARSSPGSHA